MKVQILREAGYEEALLGISLSYNALLENMPKRAEKLAHLGRGHSKFLESILVWIDVTAPRYWWAQADTYRLSTKQSESTMHTLGKRLLTNADFEGGIFAAWLEDLNQMIESKDFACVKAHLPESFLQRRIWCLSYKTLQNIVNQRAHHMLKEWHMFIDCVVEQAQHPEFLHER
jgi:hypothetical protein